MVHSTQVYFLWPKRFYFICMSKSACLVVFFKMDLYQMVSLPAFQKRRRRIDPSMIGESINFVHMAHVGSGDLFSEMNSASMSG